MMVLETSSMLAVTRLYIFIVSESSFCHQCDCVFASFCNDFLCVLTCSVRFCIMIADVDDREMCFLWCVNDFYCCFESLTSMCIAKLLIVS